MPGTETWTLNSKEFIDWFVFFSVFTLTSSPRFFRRKKEIKICFSFFLVKKPRGLGCFYTYNFVSFLFIYLLVQCRIIDLYIYKYYIFYIKIYKYNIFMYNIMVFTLFYRPREKIFHDHLNFSHSKRNWILVLSLD